MTTPHPRPLRAFWRALTQFDRQKIHAWLGLRNTLGVILPLSVGVALGYPAGALVATTGALNVAAADGVDSYRSRAIRMLASSLIGAVAVFIASLAAPSAFAILSVRTLWAFAAGLVVCLGTAAADIGMISLVVIIIYTAQSMTPSHAAESGLLALAAGLFQTVLSIAAWPIRGHQPERSVIGDFYQELARAATLPANPYDAPLASQQSTQAQEVLSSFAGDHSVEAERLFLLVSQAERIRLSLFALSRSLARIRREDASEPAAGVIDKFLSIASRVLASIGESLHGQALSNSALESLEQAERTGESLRRPGLDSDRLVEARFQIDALTGQLRAAIELSGSTTPDGEKAYVERETKAPWRLRLSGFIATLRANLSLDSSACRHAIRLAICIALGDLVARWFFIPRSYWLAMTIALVLKPDFGNTFSRGTLRLAGTYAGLLLATVLFHFTSPAVVVRIIAIAVLVLVQRSLGRANYGILVTALSAMIVFLFSFIGVAPKTVIDARALNTTMGGALALLIYLVWPTREQTQVPPALARMLDSYRLYAGAVFRKYVAGPNADPRELDRVRVNGRRARSNVETSVDRLSAEPFADAARLRLLHAMLASSHRFIHSAMALEAGMTPGAAAPPELELFSQHVEKVLELLAARLRGSAIAPDSLPNLREDHNRLVSCGNAWLNIETDRMTNSLNTLAEQIFSFTAAP